MVRDVRKYLKECEVCKATKAPNYTLKPPMGKQNLSIRRFQRLFIDILGPYPSTKVGYIGLLIILDHFFKFHWICPLRKFTASTIKDFLKKQIFHIYGVPEVVLSDHGSQFKANYFHAFTTSYKVTSMLNKTTSNGMNNLALQAVLFGTPIIGL